MYVPRSHDDKNDREDSNLLHLFLVVDSVLREQYVYRFRFVLFFVLSSCQRKDLVTNLGSF